MQGTNDIETSRRNMMYNFEAAKKELYQNENLKFRNKLTNLSLSLNKNFGLERVHKTFRQKRLNEYYRNK